MWEIKRVLQIQKPGRRREVEVSRHEYHASDEGGGDEHRPPHGRLLDVEEGGVDRGHGVGVFFLSSLSVLIVHTRVTFGLCWLYILKKAQEVDNKKTTIDIDFFVFDLGVKVGPSFIFIFSLLIRGGKGESSSRPSWPSIAPCALGTSWPRIARSGSPEAASPPPADRRDNTCSPKPFSF